MSKDNPLVQNTTQQLVQHLMSTLYGMRGCVISTEDGFMVAAHMHNENASRLSAMSSSIAALGVVAGEENQLGRCTSIVVEAEEGAIVMAQAHRPNVTLVISLIANKDAVLGQLLYAARDAAQQLERVAAAA